MAFQVESDPPDIAQALGTWRVLAASGVASSHTGSTAEVTLATVNVPANSMLANGILRISTLVSYNNNANTKTFRLKFGGALFYTFNGGAQLSAQGLVIIANRNNAALQIGAPASFHGIGASSQALSIGGINTALAQSITFTAQLDVAGDTMALERYLIEVCSRA